MTGIITDVKKIENYMLGGVKDRIVKSAPHTPIITNCTIEEFNQRCIIDQKPLVLRGSTNKWSTDSWDLDFFAQNYGKLKVYNNLYDPNKISLLTINDIIQKIKTATEDKPEYLQEWCFQEEAPELMKDFIIPEYFANDLNKDFFGYYNSTLWIGSKGANTHIHQDSVFVNVWSAQIKGKKQWILYDRNAVLNEKNGEPDFDEFLANKSNNIMYCNLEVGDILFIPFKWWHRAETLEISISLNTFYITKEIQQRFLKDLFSLPAALALNKDLLSDYDVKRYNITYARIKTFCRLMGFDPNNVLNIPVTDKEEIAA
ncbi:MAG: hypothetical protein HOM96_00675 [Rickettsiales bacterium]|nr:hypothetical protein [Rickettsiales bacterium]